MEQFGSTLWYEDLERHRQPALYYLSAQEDSTGPHLICDWNGTPTSLKELDMDILSELVEANARVPEPYAARQSSKNGRDFDNALLPCEPTAPKLNCSYTLLTENDGSHFDLLTVPPLPHCLLRRLIKKREQPSIPEEREPADMFIPVAESKPLLDRPKVGRPRKQIRRLSTGAKVPG